MGSALLRVFGWLAALPYVGLALLVLTGGPSWSAIGYVVATGVLLGGLSTLPRPGRAPQRRRGMSRLGAAAIASVALLRACVVSDGRTLRVTTGAGGSARVVSRLVDESDVSIAAARAIVATGMVRDDAAELPAAMRSAYKAMRREEGDVASPMLATHLGLQGPGGFDLVVVDGSAPARGAVVFLHGTAGNFDLPCLRLARALEPLGVTTACPSTRWVADWGAADGEAIVRRTLERLRARGVTRFVLAGLSAGGYGASSLAPRMPGAFAGLLLVSGAEPGARPAGVPTLVLHGSRDTMAPVDDARAYVVGTGARYEEIDAGHFAMLVKAPVLDPVIRGFVGECLPLDE